MESTSNCERRSEVNLAREGISAREVRGLTTSLVAACALVLVLSLLASPASAVIITEFPIPTGNSETFDITAGPDGNLWFTEQVGNKIGRITPAGVITEFPIPSFGPFGSSVVPVGITAGPDGNLWFTEFRSFANKIGRITPAGVITEFPIPTADSGPVGITAGPDGNLWFTERFGNKIGRLEFVVVVPFAAFSAQAEINVAAGEFEVKGSFTLGTGSNGIDPLTEDVSIQVGTFSTTIPAGSFVLTNSGPFGEFEFEGVIAGVSLKVRIRPLGGGMFEFRAEGEGANLTGTVNPVTVDITIGDDGGTTSITAEFQ